MPELKYDKLFKNLFLAGFLAYITVFFFGNAWVGLVTLVVFSWLFYEFRRKVVIFNRVLLDYLPGGSINFLRVTKEVTKEWFWDYNQARIYSFAIMPIIFTLSAFVAGYWSLGNEGLFTVSLDEVNRPAHWILVIVMFSLFWLYFVKASTGSYIRSVTITDEKMSRLIRGQYLGDFFKTVIQIAVLIIWEINSRELIAVSLYSLSGMIYILTFPPFEMTPAVTFVSAIGCGLFTGSFGLVIHKVISFTWTQRVLNGILEW